MASTAALKPSLTAAPQTQDPQIAVEHKSQVAEALSEVLADTYLLIVKTHAYHWNVVGPLFYSVHNMTEEQYRDMFAAADELAERMRALGALAPMNMRSMADKSEIDEANGAPDAVSMVADLAASHETLSRRLHRLIEVAEGAGDAVTEDLATERAAFHDKSAWMLRALITG